METYEDILDALGDPTRRRIVELLRGGPLAVGEIAGELPVSRPAVSQHLRILHRAGLVHPVRAGTRRIYHLSPEGLASLRRFVDGLWSDVLDAFGSYAEAEIGKEDKR